MARSKIGKGLWALAGFISFGLGLIGAVLPVIPTVPFILLAAFCFARSSERLNAWFKQTKLYHQVLESFVDRRTMTVKAKLSILVPVTILLAIAFVLMSRVPVGQVILAVVWIGHVIYFGFVVKTEKPNEPGANVRQSVSSNAAAGSAQQKETSSEVSGLSSLEERQPAE